MATNKRPEAVLHLHKALQIIEKLGKRDPNNTEWQRDRSVIYDRLGDLQDVMGKKEEAAQWRQKAYAQLKGMQEQSVMPPSDEVLLQELELKAGITQPTASGGKADRR